MLVLSRLNDRRACVLAAIVGCHAGAPTAWADTWPMRGRDGEHTGRAGFVVPASRRNGSFFDVFAWQTPTPGSPGEGGVEGGAVFFDGVGPEGADLLAAGYHWPKGVIGLDRRSGRVFWSGNPAGGESIGRNTPAFSPDGSVLYVTNDATDHPLMAFQAATGPGEFRHNGGFNNPDAGAWSPLVTPDGRVITANWCSNVAAFLDTGADLERTATALDTCSCYPTAAAHQDGNVLRIMVASRCGFLSCYDGGTGALLWRAGLGVGTDAAATIDPADGRVFVPLGSDDVHVAGVDRFGNPLWGESRTLLLFDHVNGVNNPQRAQSGGCLSHNGLRYYFQTISAAGDGGLYAIDTSTGELAWFLDTASRGGEMAASSPIVTPDGVIIVGNNLGGIYLAVQDLGSSGQVLDVMQVAPGGLASASAALSDDGLLYLPLRTHWVAPNGSGGVPTGTVQNLIGCLDLRAGASAVLPPPPNQTAAIGNHLVRLTWSAVADPSGVFAAYEVYRSVSPFDSLQGLTPIATLSSITTTTYTDSDASNNVPYYYAVSTLTSSGGRPAVVASIGPRTPRDETDLQVLSIARTPRYPRYWAEYTGYTVTEPSGFGPYFFTAATGLGGGQTDQTQRWPEPGDPVTYTATIRNRGTNAWTGPVDARWLVDGQIVSEVSLPGSLAPGLTTPSNLVLIWDAQDHEVQLQTLVTDDRDANNALATSSRSVAFLTYVDQTYAEDFRERSGTLFPLAQTDDIFDWLNRHAARMNEMFGQAGSPKRIHYDVLERTADAAPDPAPPGGAISYAIFPFRYRATDGDARYSGYYSAADDIDYGLLHEMGHQLGLIDLYQLNLGPDQNAVSHTGYSTVPCLMHGVSPFFSEHSARAMTLWNDQAHGYFGQYMYRLPETIRVRLLSLHGQPLAGAAVRVYQMVERPAIGKVITRQAKFTGQADGLGHFTLPNVEIDQGLVPPLPTGDTLRDNPFGYVAVVGTNGVLLLEVEDRGFVDHAWLDITECNVAYWRGQTGLATFERRLALGGGIQRTPPADMAELNAQDWRLWAQDGEISASDDRDERRAGEASVHLAATGGSDNSARYPGALLARWDLRATEELRFWVLASNPNGSFQNASPWVRLLGGDGYIEFHPVWDILNDAIGQWQEFVVPLVGDGTWQRSIVGTATLDDIRGVEFHADTWGAGFELWLDGVRFNPPLCPSDFDRDGFVTGLDFDAFVAAFETGEETSDFDGDGFVTGLDFDAFVAAFESGC